MFKAFDVLFFIHINGAINGEAISPASWSTEDLDSPTMPARGMDVFEINGRDKL